MKKIMPKLHQKRTSTKPIPRRRRQHNSLFPFPPFFVFMFVFAIIQMMILLNAGSEPVEFAPGYVPIEELNEPVETPYNTVFVYPSNVRLYNNEGMITTEEELSSDWIRYVFELRIEFDNPEDAVSIICIEHKFYHFDLLGANARVPSPDDMEFRRGYTVQCWELEEKELQYMGMEVEPYDEDQVVKIQLFRKEMRVVNETKMG